LNAQNTNDKNLTDLVKKNAAPLHLRPFDADHAMISYAFVDSKTNIQYVYLQQAYQHIKVYNSIMTIIFRDNEVLYSSGKFVDSLEFKVGSAQASPALSAELAINKAATHLDLPLPSGLRSIENKFSQEKKIIFSPAGIAKNNIETELVWVASDDGSEVKLAWNVSIDELHSSDWWNVRIDARTGAYIEKNNFTVHEQSAMETDEFPGTIINRKYFPGNAGTGIPGSPVLVVLQNKTFIQYLPPTVTNAAYYVSAQPSESPRHNPMVLVNQPWLRAGVGNPAITNGWHFDGTTNYDITRGNNVHAYLDVANSNNPGSPANVPVVSTTPIPALTFNYVPDFNQQPSLTVNRQAAVTNLFYWNNTNHDILYQYGFDEVSGNFQTDNLARGGLGNDYVQAEAQDGGGTDNANMATPADGARPRMQMYLWSGVPTFTVNTPAVIAGNYFATESGFSTNNKLLNVGPRTGQVVYYNDDLAGTTHEACGVPANSLVGKIAMINRGTCTFVIKVKNAQNAGAIAVIMVNNVPGLPITMGGADNTITIPAVMISQSDGAILAAQLGNNLNVTMSGGVNIDGDFDNGVVTHEYGHGVSNRLTGGAPNAGCLNNAEQGGEGWSDYLGMMLTTNWATAALTDGALPKPLGAYALGQPLNGTGIRTYPYSTNMTINPQTYSNVAVNGEVHFIGEIWCAAIWDMTWFIIQQEGVINPNIYSPTPNGGNSIALKLVLEGMRLQTCRPGFLDSRDAILAADSILYNGRHKCAIWAAFARRGMGLSAVQGSSGSTTDQVAAFDVPSLVQLNKLATPLTVVQPELVNVNLSATCQCLVNTNYTLRDTIPAGFTYVSSTGGTLAGNVVTFSPLNFSATQETKSFIVLITPNNSGCALVTNINDNRDGSTTGGLASVIATGATNWVTSAARSTSPTTSWFAASNNTNRDFSLTSGAAGFTAGSLSVLSFKHFFITKNTIEGGRVEYSTNGGTTWLDAGPFIVQQGYNNTSSVATPWGVGQKMFGGVSFGRGSGQFINTIIDLSSLSSQNVRIRFRSRGTTTNLGTFEGWYLDDILQMDGCGGMVKAGLYNGAAARVDSLASPVFIKTGIAVSITTQPANTGACVGTNATFTVVANPATSPTYQWQLSTNAGVTFNDIAGQTSSILIVPSVTLSMTGYQYRVRVSSSLSNGYIYSVNAILTVNTAPTIVCPANITVNNTPGVCGAVVNYPPATGTGIPAPTFTYSIPSGSFFRVGTTTVIATATNVCGAAPCTFTITVIDNQPPVITCPAPITANNTPGQCSAVVNYPLPTVTDNCCLPGAITLTQTASQTPVAGSVACNAGGFHTANSYWRAYDLSTMCLSGPLTINSVQFGIELADANGTGTTQPVNINIYISPGPFPGSPRTLVGTTGVLLIPDQNLTTFTANLIVPPTVSVNVTLILELQTPDGRAPANNRFFIGSNASAQTGPSYISAADCGIAIPTDLTALGFPNMHIILNANGATAGPNPLTQIAGLPSGSIFPVGVTTNTFRATDVAGNTSTCSFTVTVVDAQAPSITCPANIVRNTDPGVCTATIATPDPTTSDNCAVTTVTWAMTGATVASSPATGINFVGTKTFNVSGTTGQGVTTITYTVKDAAGNTTTCSYTVTVNDIAIPVIGINGQPTNQTVCVGTNALFNVTATVPSGNPLAYQWQGWNGTAWVNIAGANASTLTLNAVTFSMNTNSYRCILTGLCSVITSGYATLYVNQLPSISLSASGPLALLPAQSVTLTAVVNPGGGSYQWFKNGIAIAGAMGGSLTGLTVDDIGAFRCRYTDLNGCVATSADMAVSGQVSDGLFIYPIPNNGHFHIRFYNQPNEEATVRIFDMKGSQLYVKKVITTLPYTNIEVELMSDRITATEAYLVEVRGNKGRLIGAKKIIVYK
jgi:hypothetical protein